MPRSSHGHPAARAATSTHSAPAAIDPEIARILAAHADREGSLLPILHDIQAAFGHVPESAIPAIAHALNLSRAEVHGVISFYHDFHVDHDPLPVIRLCRAESCQARGVEALAAAFSGETRVRIEPVYCLGLCTVGPNAMVGDAVHARLDTTRFAALVERTVVEQVA
jgi:formate dehydrogenase subunit gamma